MSLGPWWAHSRGRGPSHARGRGPHPWWGHAHRSSSSRGDPHWGTHGRPHARWWAHHAWRWCPPAHRWGRTPTAGRVLGRGPRDAGRGSSCSSGHSPSSLRGHHLLGWPTNPSDWPRQSCGSLGHRNTSWDSPASSPANPWAPGSSSKRHSGNASIFGRRSLYCH